MHSVQDIRDHLRALGANERHEQRVLRLWAQAKPQDSGRRALESFMRCLL
jgi:23S rRNA (adenine2503-C2)-methyltransferase